MTYQPLHHKYRPQTFADLVGQEAIAATLTHAIQQQRIAPAYLFTGARGTGKTSSARILAKSLNCLKYEAPTEKPCGQCEVCRAIAHSNALDVIEIDAASNTGVDNIRELIERAQFAPVQCRYKVYIIDEVHMLSTAAFNALLKTLEEPPDRIVFVLATTDPQRVLPTIISRCQRFDFRRIPLDAMVAHLQKIADKEAIAITEDAITLVAQISQGGLRDAESLLDQLSLLAEEVTVEKVWDLVGSVPERDLMSLLEAIAQDNPEALLDSTRRLMDQGREPLIVLQNLASFFRDLLIAKTAPDRNDLVALTAPTWSKLCEFAQTLETGTILAGQQHLRSCETQLKNTTQPRLWLEITLMGLLPSAIRPLGGGSVGSGPLNGVVEGQPIPQKSVVPGAGAMAENRTVVNTQPQAKAAISPQPSAASPGSFQPSAQSVNSFQAEEEEEDLKDETVLEPQPVTVAEPAEVTYQPIDTNLGQIWQQIIAHLHPLSKALLNEHGQLLGFDGQEVRIGISSDKLVKIAQNQVKNIEKAFAEVFQQKVRVSLEVASPFAARASSAESYPSSAPASDVSDASEDAEQFAKNSNPPPARKPAPRNPSTQLSAVPEANSSLEALPPTAAEGTRKKKAARPAKPPVNSWEEDEAVRAAKQLAEFFAGKVVSDSEDVFEIAELDSEPTKTFEPDATKWTTADEEEEADDDVPF
ncbi:DNA polymerase III subunit gamma/tau [Leptothermofonsia sp. ETS-13]|uniref:DNA polymerase III subunit gamma/tau n=1 Tax=Leptothermofonsia sp. ETS-13 TaxID=3035696 RepID=UPI003BA3323E